MFDSLFGAIAKFGMISAQYKAIQTISVEAGAKLFLEKAQAAIGTYEYGWPRLAESTLSRKQADTPGLETGEMKESGYYEVHGASATIGFTDPKITWFEFGTSRQPPRPVIGGTIDHHGQEIAELMGVRVGETIGAALITGRIFPTVGRMLGL